MNEKRSSDEGLFFAQFKTVTKIKEAILFKKASSLIKILSGYTY